MTSVEVDSVGNSVEQIQTKIRYGQTAALICPDKRGPGSQMPREEFTSDRLEAGRTRQATTTGGSSALPAPDM